MAHTHTHTIGSVGVAAIFDSNVSENLSRETRGRCYLLIARAPEPSRSIATVASWDTQTGCTASHLAMCYNPFSANGRILLLIKFHRSEKVSECAVLFVRSGFATIFPKTRTGQAIGSDERSSCRFFDDKTLESQFYLRTHQRRPYTCICSILHDFGVHVRGTNSLYKLSCAEYNVEIYWLAVSAIRNY
jgi:hypothetical protein